MIHVCLEPTQQPWDNPLLPEPRRTVWHGDTLDIRQRVKGVGGARVNEQGQMHIIPPGEGVSQPAAIAADSRVVICDTASIEDNVHYQPLLLKTSTLQHIIQFVTS